MGWVERKGDFGSSHMDMKLDSVDDHRPLFPPSQPPSLCGHPCLARPPSFKILEGEN